MQVSRARSSSEVRIALIGDTMLGRKVGERLAEDSSAPLIAPELIEIVGEADLVLLNLECCISERGERWPEPGKPFFFRAPPAAVEVLETLGTSCVTLANNHALDYGFDALLDTLDYLASAGISYVGAGPDLKRARAPVILESDGLRLAVAGVTDHPASFAASLDRPGVAYVDLESGVPPWLTSLITSPPDQADAVVVLPHWGPNMVDRPVRHVRRAAKAMLDSGATLIAGHSAHVFQGVSGPVLFDLGDFLDDYAVDAVLRNDLGLLFLVSLDHHGPQHLEAIPLRLDYCYTRLADANDISWIRRRFRAACEEFGTSISEDNGRLVVKW